MELEILRRFGERSRRRTPKSGLSSTSPGSIPLVLGSYATCHEWHSVLDLANDAATAIEHFPKRASMRFEKSACTE
jgi:hypothetical protein